MSPHSAKSTKPRVDSSTAAILGLPRPVTFTELVRASSRLYVRKAGSLISMFLVLYAFERAARWGLGRLSEDASIQLTSLMAISFRVVVSIVAAFVMAAATLILAETVVGHATAADSIRGTLRAHAREIFASGSFAALILIFLSFFGLGELLTVATIGPPFVIHAIILEYRPFRQALQRTRALLAGEWARVLLVVLGLVLAAFLAQLIVGLAVAAPTAALGGDAALDAVAWGFWIVIPALVAPFFAASMLVLYLDVRARRERLDPRSFAAERENAMSVPALSGSNLD